MSAMTPTPLTLHRSLGDLVAELPARARVLERLGLDYCCHGTRTVADAATDAGLDATALVAELLAVTDPTDAHVDRLDPIALVDHILEAHHDYLHEELPLLVELAEKVRDVHGEHHPELTFVAALVVELHDDLGPHLAKEEKVLFPAIRAWVAGAQSVPFGSLHRPVRMMMLEHDRAGELLQSLRGTTEGYTVPSDGCASYESLYDRLAHLESDTHRHVHLENNVLFPAVTG